MAELDSRRAEKLNNAARTIQRKIRTHIARQHFLALRKATIVIQTLWRSMPLANSKSFLAIKRFEILALFIILLLFFSPTFVFAGRLACKLFEGLRREAASIKVQKNLRRHLSRKSYSRVRFSALTLQTGSRVLAARNEFRYRQQTKAAKIIQVILVFLLKCLV